MRLWGSSTLYASFSLLVRALTSGGFYSALERQWLGCHFFRLGRYRDHRKSGICDNGRTYFPRLSLMCLQGSANFTPNYLQFSVRHGPLGQHMESAGRERRPRAQVDSNSD
ncbi:hypothetical protein SCHPADRAFT_908332 [Schizopora paradoxa]|uniref:Secreted protein n=1 Tax=Schizopora paradoxa TaxID=27342 RepID=A0A0H2RAA8_9AGAM|nr:hypothetical protein SCHPADRAFT_908332 [Schizopora paradoxa]